MTNTRYKIDEHGVPILSADDIELKAEEVISYFDAKLLEIPAVIPLTELVEKFHVDFGMGRNYSSDLGTTKYGGKILGKTQLKPLTVFVDCSLADDERFRFVLGHELGHVVFHRRVDIKASDYEEQEIVDTEQDFLTGKKILKTTRDWLEWQANRFSSAILMPRSSIYSAVVAFQKKADIIRNVGKIVLVNESYSYRDFNAILEYLKLLFNVNATTAEYRLTDLSILDDLRLMDVKHVSELFMAEAEGSLNGKNININIE